MDKPTKDVICFMVEHHLKVIGAENIVDDANLRDDCGLDSLDVLDLGVGVCKSLQEMYPDYPISSRDIDFPDYPKMTVERAKSYLVEKIIG